MLAVFDLIWWGNTNHWTGIGHAAGDDTIADLIEAVNDASNIAQDFLGDHVKLYSGI